MQPPMWDWNPRETMLQFTTGPQQPISTRHSLSPYSSAKTLLVVAGPRAAAVDGLGEEPGRTAELVELRQRPDALQEEQDRRHRLREVVPYGGQPGTLITGSPRALR